MSRERRAFLLLTPRLNGFDGISEVSRQVGRTLAAEAGGSLEIWALEGEEPREGESIPGRRFQSAHGSRARMVAWTLGRAVNLLDGLTVVAMHIHLAPLGAILAARGASLTVFLHGVEAWRRLRPRERAAVRAARHVIANSNRTVERFRSANPDLREIAVTVCPLGVSATGTDVAAADANGFALIVGRLAAAERYKGHDALIDAWPGVQAKAPGARLIVAGDGDDRARLEARVAAAGLDDAIQFRGAVSLPELRGLYRACAVFVMPSSGEGFGLAYLEAMREGKPCLALRSADEIIENGVTGLLLDEARPESLSTAIGQLLSDDALRRRMGAAAVERFATRFTDAHFSRRFREAMVLDSR